MNGPGLPRQASQGLVCSDHISHRNQTSGTLWILYFNYTVLTQFALKNNCKWPSGGSPDTSYCYLSKSFLKVCFKGTLRKILLLDTSIILALGQTCFIQPTEAENIKFSLCLVKPTAGFTGRLQLCLRWVSMPIYSRGSCKTLWKDLILVDESAKLTSVQRPRYWGEFLKISGTYLSVSAAVFGVSETFFEVALSLFDSNT